MRPAFNLTMSRGPFDNLDGSVNVPVNPDAQGYVDRECPAGDCQFVFKVHHEDWRAIFRDEAVYCPQCGRPASSDKWWTTEQVEHARNEAVKEVHRRLDKALSNWTRSQNRRLPQGGFVSIQWSYRGRQVPPMVAVQCREAFQVLLQCSQCKARYAVVGSAFFCPACGANEVERQFDQAMQAIEALAGNWTALSGAMVSALGRDAANGELRSLVEGRLSDVVTAFQAVVDHMYRRLPNAPAIRGALFQRIEDGSQAWLTAIAVSYSAFLNEAELRRMNILFQRRHLLEHTDGIVDVKYLKNSGDQEYGSGQRVVVRIQDVVELAQLTRKVVKGLLAAIAALHRFPDSEADG